MNREVKIRFISYWNNYVKFDCFIRLLLDLYDTVCQNVNYYYFRNPTSTVKSKAKKHFKLLFDDKNNSKKSVLKFLREKNAKFADEKYWAIEKNIPSDRFSIIRIKESVFTKRFYLFSFLLVREKISL